MKTLFTVLAFFSALAAQAEGPSLPPPSFERLERFSDGIREARFPVTLRDFIALVGGEKEVVVSSYSSGTKSLEIFVRICAPNSEGGVYQIRLRAKDSPKSGVMDAVCEEAQLIYLSESGMHLFVLEDPVPKRPIQPPQPTRGKAPRG